LEGASKEKTAEARLVLEQLQVRFRLVFVLKRKLVLNLLKLGLYPWVILIAMSVQFGKIAKAFFNATMVDQPAR
jgi:hypothetical protein